MIGMVSSNLIDRIFALPLEDQFELLDRLHERLRNEPELLELSEEHRRILDERIDDCERTPHEGSPWEQVRDRIRSNLGLR